MSVAVAVIDTDAGAVNVAPFAGPDSDTAGGWFAGVVTAICAVADVAVAPVLSLAIASPCSCRQERSPTSWNMGCWYPNTHASCRQ